MDTSLNDAAFRLISHSRIAVDANTRALRTDEARLDALGVMFPHAVPKEIAEAQERAMRLVATAIEMADIFRGPGDGHRGPPFTCETLAERCPGFSDETYDWAINDGFTETRN